MSYNEPKIKVFASDDNLKELGELLSNDSSRKIIYNLMIKEMYTNEIATKLEIRVSLVIHHLKKMEDLGMLIITNKRIKRKGQEHRFFKIDSNILVVMDQNRKEIEEKGLLTKIFREGIKFASIGIAAFISSRIFPSDAQIQGASSDPIIPFSNIPLIIIIIGLSIWLIIEKKKNLV